MQPRVKGQCGRRTQDERSCQFQRARAQQRRFLRCTTFGQPFTQPTRIKMAAESTKEATADGHKVTTVVEGTDATAAAPTEPKVAIVTGASRGLGRGVAAILAKEAGFTVYAAGRTTADLEKLQAECADGPGKVVPCTLDLKDDEAVKAFVEKVKAEAGRIDVLVNSAYQGLAVTKPHLGKKFYEQPLSTYDDHMSGGALGLCPVTASGAVNGRGEERLDRQHIPGGRRPLPVLDAVRRDARGDGPTRGGHGRGAQGDGRGRREPLARRGGHGTRRVSRRRDARVRGPRRRRARCGG